MRRAALLGLMLVSAGCQPFRAPPGVAPPGVGVLVQGIAGRCAPIVVGGTVRRMCLPPPAERDTAQADSAAVTR
jgi:hypothetical protein